MYECFFDGACEPNGSAGRMAYASIIYKDGLVISNRYGRIADNICKGDKSNNIAEYAAFIETLEELLRIKAQDKPITINGDSMMVIHQMFGDWRIKRGMYLPMAAKASALVGEFSDLNGIWIPREENAAADTLCQAALKEPNSPKN